MPYRHIATYDEATDAEVAEIGAVTQTAMRVIGQTSRADGFNIGMNQGAIAGAGIAAHLHQHVVPRWAADANFFPIIARTKALPVLLGEVRETLADGVASAQLTHLELHAGVRVELLRLHELQLALARLVGGAQQVEDARDRARERRGRVDPVAR